MQSNGARPETGALFGHYRLGRLLGRGGFGEVYEAEDTDKNRVVALKLIAAPYSNNAAFRERLFREAAAAGRLHDPHVVPIHDFGEIDGQVYIDMRLVAGVDLSTVLDRDGTIDPQRTTWIVRQLASALDAAHAAGLVHRDVKPANALLTAEDFVYLVDFGLANAVGDSKLTSTGATIGTLAYMAPERFLHGAGVDHRADVYALACMLFECLTGTTPYPATGDLPALLGAHLNAPIPRPSQHRPHLPAAFDEVIERGMAKDPAHRYSSAGDLAQAAQRALTGAAPVSTVAAATSSPGTAEWEDARAPQIGQPPPTASPPASGRPRRRFGRTAAITAAVLAAVTALAVGIVVGFAHRDAPPKASSPTARSSPSAAPASQPASRQVVLPFIGLGWLSGGLAVDAAGAVYVADKEHHRVVKLPADGAAQLELPFQVAEPVGVAVTARGDVYVTDGWHHKGWMLTAGSTTPTRLPLQNVKEPRGIAVDGVGNLYIADSTQSAADGRVWRLEAGSSNPIAMSFPDVAYPSGVAVDPAGAVYVSGQQAGSFDAGVWKLPPGAVAPTRLPFGPLNTMWAGSLGGVAVDAAGDTYVTDQLNSRVLKLSAGSDSPLVVPLSGLRWPMGLAVDVAGNLYVADSGYQVVKLPVG